jgi:hypothetical protein
MRSAKAKTVDEYIANASECTRPILIRLRRIFNQASPKLEESIKWGIPCFTCKGPVGGIAAYKHHVTWGLWKASMLNDPHGLIGNGILKGGKIASISEIPPAAKLAALIQQAVALNEAGVKPITPVPELPADFAVRLSSPKSAAMNKSGNAAKHWAALTPARQWQYVNWVTKAKRPETRARRIAMAIERIGKDIPMK